MRTQEKPQTMASNNVSGRLGQSGQIKPFADVEPEQGPSELAQPEALLWLAVIDRAIADYVKRPPELSIKYRQGLDWFFFEEEPEQFNLQYLCDQLFDDSSTAVSIRNRVITMLKNEGREIEQYTKKRYALRVNSRYY